MTRNTATNTAGLRSTAAAPAQDVPSNLRKLEPRVDMPTPSMLNGFSPEQVERLRHLCSEPMEYVPHPSFRSASAEAEYDVITPPPVATPTPGLVDDDLHESRRRRNAHLVRGLPREQEELLFLRHNYARFRVMRVLREFRGRRLTRSSARLVLHWDERACSARDALVQANMGLVPTMIERSRITGVDFGDLISEGQMALLRSVSKFDCARGFKFSTYACRAILSALARAMALAVRHRTRFPAEYDPDQQKSDEQERRRDSIAVEFVEELNSVLESNLAQLTETEKRVLLERFGVNGEKRRPPERSTKTLRQVAALFGVTKERVRQIQNRALDKLRIALEERVFAA